MAQVLRGALWLYPLVNLAHVLGIVLLFGAVTISDLRLMGLWRVIPLAALTGPTIPVAVAGFGLAATSGAALVSVKATKYSANPFLYAKFGGVAFAGANAAALHASSAWRTRHRDSDASHGRFWVAGSVSLACWLASVAAGRMIAYW